MLRILTLNVGSLFEANWSNRRHEIVAWIDRLAPDVICLQEIHESPTTSNTGAWIAENASAEWHHVFGGHELDERVAGTPGVVFGSSVLSLWPIDSHEAHRLPVYEPALDVDPSPSFVPWELLHANTAGLDVFTTHLAAAPSHGLHRCAQVQAIDSIVRAVRGDRDQLTFGSPRDFMPAVLCGDMNAEPDSDEMRFLRGVTDLGGATTFWQDAWQVAGSGGHGLTQDWRTHALAAKLNVHRKRIDYIYVGDPFIRTDDAGRVLHCQVVCDQPLTGLQASDHCGVVAEIVWPHRPVDAPPTR